MLRQELCQVDVRTVTCYSSDHFRLELLLPGRGADDDWKRKDHECWEQLAWQSEVIACIDDHMQKRGENDDLMM